MNVQSKTTLNNGSVSLLSRSTRCHQAEIRLPHKLLIICAFACGMLFTGCTSETQDSNTKDSALDKLPPRSRIILVGANDTWTRYFAGKIRGLKDIADVRINDFTHAEKSMVIFFYCGESNSLNTLTAYEATDGHLLSNYGLLFVYDEKSTSKDIRDYLRADLSKTIQSLAVDSDLSDLPVAEVPTDATRLEAEFTKILTHHTESTQFELPEGGLWNAAIDSVVQ